MLTAIPVFLKLVLGGVLGFLKAAIAFLVEHPKVLMCVVCLTVGCGLGWAVATKRADKKIEAAKAELVRIKQDGEKASAEIKERSKEEADKNEAQLTELQLRLDETTKNYEAALKANKVIRYVKVPVPGKPEVSVDVAFEGDKQVCRSYPSTYVDKVNELVRKTEEALK